MGCNAALQRYAAAAGDDETRSLFIRATALVERFAGTVINLISGVQGYSSPSNQTSSDGDLLYRVASSGIVILQSGAMAYKRLQGWNLPGSMKMCAIHVDAVKLLVNLLAGMHPGQQRALAVLRSTTYS